jgi:hypothetical protein
MFKKIKKEWYFVYWTQENRIVGAFPSLGDATEYGNHTCWPNEHKVFPMIMETHDKEEVKSE